MPDIRPDHLVRLSGNLGDVFSSVQSERGVVVPSTVRSFLESLVQESLILRGSEWQETQGLDLEDAEQVRGATDVAAEAAYNILIDAPVETNEEGELLNYVSLIGTVEGIQQNYCGVFPFCRYRE